MKKLSIKTLMTLMLLGAGFTTAIKAAELTAQAAEQTAQETQNYWYYLTYAATQEENLPALSESLTDIPNFDAARPFQCLNDHESAASLMWLQMNVQRWATSINRKHHSLGLTELVLRSCYRQNLRTEYEITKDKYLGEFSQEEITSAQKKNREKGHLFSYNELRASELVEIYTTWRYPKTWHTINDLRHQGLSLSGRDIRRILNETRALCLEKFVETDPENDTTDQLTLKNKAMRKWHTYIAEQYEDFDTWLANECSYF